MTSPPPPPHLSPDGLWWWDGGSWRPVNSAPISSAPGSHRDSSGLWTGAGVFGGLGILALMKSTASNDLTALVVGLLFVAGAFVIAAVVRR